jgi:2-oxoglutarate dehydrogenase E2 component (dihydrolipoamide succinyltransferase)
MSVDIIVPEVGESVVDARVSRWLKKEGDAVAAGEALVELETDKVDVEVTAPKAGVLETIAHGDGVDVKIGDVLGSIKEGAAGPASATSSTGTAGTKRPAPKRAPAATPSARKLAREEDLELRDVRAEGPRVTRRDVQRSLGSDTVAEAKPAPAPATPSPAPWTFQTPTPGDRRETRERMSKRRATIARRLVEAQQTAAMLTTFNEVDMSAVLSFKKVTGSPARGVASGTENLAID